MSKVPFSEFMRATNTDGDVGYRKPLRSLMQAAEADQQNHPLIRQAMQMARRFGVTLDPDHVDIVQLDRELKASRATIEEKIRLKTLLAQIGAIR
jgi:K+-sensing histidine kinase KdpD